jgi:shikimate dehydrogenase
MRKFGLIGYPLSHSFSKKYFSDKFNKENIEGCSYENYPMTDISQLLQLISADRLIAGLNVTIPYKSAVIDYISSLEDEAAEIGAVNVLKIKWTGDRSEIKGFNSDVTGIRETIIPLMTTSVREALVLGTGGAAKAAFHVLTKLSVKCTLISRTPKPGCLTYSDIDRKLIDRIQLIINTTPLGTYPNVNIRPQLDYSILDKRHLLFDMVYNPEITSFLREGQERGCTTVNGMKMLISQAERSWEIWNDDSL